MRQQPYAKESANKPNGTAQRHVPSHQGPRRSPRPLLGPPPTTVKGKIQAHGRRLSAQITGQIRRFSGHSVELQRGPKSRGWRWVKQNLPRIREFGRQEGILPPRPSVVHPLPSFSRGKKVRVLNGCAYRFDYVNNVQEDSELDAEVSHILHVLAPQAQEIEQIQQEKPAARSDKGNVLNLPTNDSSLIHSAIPFLPVPAAVLCCFLNVFAPGLGTFLSGFFLLCCGQPRILHKHSRTSSSISVNILVGICQSATITFLLVGWFWSIAWGGLMVIYSIQYRDALEQRRREAVATAAFEVLTKDGVLRKNDIRSLLKKQGGGPVQAV